MDPQARTGAGKPARLVRLCSYAAILLVLRRLIGSLVHIKFTFQKLKPFIDETVKLLAQVRWDIDIAEQDLHDRRADC